MSIRSHAGFDQGGALGPWVGDLHTALLAEIDPEVEGRHLAAMTQARHAIAEVSSIGVAWRRRTAAAAAAAGLVVIFGSAGVAAATGSLPGPAQRAVVSILGPVGVDLPSPPGDDRHEPATDHGANGAAQPEATTDAGSSGADTPGEKQTGETGRPDAPGASGGHPSATPATPAIPATPGGPGQRAIPATPATPATPADPDHGNARSKGVKPSTASPVTTSKHASR
jgi:hypothetical protein